MKRTKLKKKIYKELKGSLSLSKIENIVDDARNGRMFVLVDDEGRENEGDLIIPAQMATPANINFMAKNGRGLICLAMTKKRSKILDLAPMHRRNPGNFDTAFTVSIESVEGVTTGISAADRAKTIQVAINSTSGKNDIRTPGHVFPLVARDGGVLARAGHTEAAVDISRLAGLNSSAVICEIMNDDGTMARFKDLLKFCKKHDLKIASIEDLIRWRVRNDPIVKQVYKNTLKTEFAGDFSLYIYSNTIEPVEHIAIVKGKINSKNPIAVRVHKINYISDVLSGSLDDKTKIGSNTIRKAMIEIDKRDSGVIVLIRDSNASNISTELLENDSKNKSSFREYGVGAQILRDLGVREMILLSNAHKVIIGLEGFDLKVVDYIDLENSHER